MMDLWCRLWSRVQDVAFWVDDKTHTTWTGTVVTEFITYITPNDY